MAAYVFRSAKENIVSSTVTLVFWKQNELYRNILDLPLLVYVCCKVQGVRECVAVHVTWEPVRIEGLFHWPAVLRSIFYVGVRLACREIPNNSFFFPYCMVWIIPVFPLHWRIHIYGLISVMHTLKSGYWFLCMVRIHYVSLLLSFDLSYIWIVATVAFHFVDPTGNFAGLKYFVIELLMYSVCGTWGILNLECLKKLVIFAISGFWYENNTHILACCLAVVGSFVSVFWLSVSSLGCEWYEILIHYFVLLQVLFSILVV